MKIKNEQFGEIQYDEKSILNFKEGLLGFEDLKQFLLISEKDSIFFWLTSIDQPEIIFPLFSINLIVDNFKSETEEEPFGIVKLDKNPEDITINLKAPVFINQEAKFGYQKIIDSDELAVDYPLFIKN